MATVGEALALALKRAGVGVVFGIPGVHTIELYRGLAVAGLRHVTPRHEQGAGFMADGYARATGRPGVAFVITGPGVTNILTPMAQARADSVPMLVVSGVNARASLGRGLGHLHELPDQHALAAGVAVLSRHVRGPEDLGPALAEVLGRLGSGRPGPVHLQVPLDVMGMAAPALGPIAAPPAPPAPDPAAVAEAAARLSRARAPVILAGGGARGAAGALIALARRLGAPVVQTTNARGIMHADPLVVPASPSLPAVRALIAGADAVLAVGTEFGQTDYDMYVTGGMAPMAGLVRIDICPEQLARHPAEVAITADAGAGLAALGAALGAGAGAADGAARASAARAGAWADLSGAMRAQAAILGAIARALPEAPIVGDSTQPVYAGNLWHDAPRPGGWFNAATGYGALGYAIPAAIGAAVGLGPGAPVVCLAGDGGAQFSLAELMCARDEGLGIRFVIWNNRGYREIAEAMAGAGAPVVGCDPTPPDFAAIAQACAIPHRPVPATPEAVAAACAAPAPDGGPVLIEVDAR
ncbi:MAG: 5-guanidino-2-oxopentanoate decarboxylase [Gemmobacter sp.]